MKAVAVVIYGHVTAVLVDLSRLQCKLGFGYYGTVPDDYRCKRPSPLNQDKWSFDGTTAERTYGPQFSNAGKPASLSKNLRGTLRHIPLSLEKSEDWGVRISMILPC